jgi:peptidoglycan/LPS O-acetylase OafA/YrhL
LKEPLGVSLGHCAVLVFFVLSGVLIARAAERTGIADFWIARGLRIAPGLFTALVFSVLCAVATGASPSLSEITAYLLRGMSLVGLEHTLTGAYATNPYRGAVNGPLWTLFYEVVCYAAVAALVWSGCIRKTGWLFLLLGAGGAVVVAEFTCLPHYRLTIGAPLAFAFVLGAAAWAWRDTVLLRWDIAVVTLAGGSCIGALASSDAVTHIALAVGLGYAALVFGLREGAQSLGGDISYGIYVLGWPVAQTLVALFGPMTPETLAVFSIAVVVPCAALSWVLLERPALALRRSIQTAKVA